jgi:OOP family OmpA-OmpF porin
MSLSARLNLSSPRRLACLTASAGLIALMLAGCADDSDQTAAGSPFTQALFKDYTDLSTQAASAPAPAANQDEGFFDSLFDIFGGPSNPNDALAQAFSDKATIAANGQEPDPEAGAADPVVQGVRDRLVRDLAAGKDQFPEQAARAQADYDCWVLSAAVPTAAAAAQACKSSLDGSLLALENAERPALPVPAPAPAPVATAPVAAPAPSDFTVYFNFDSWTLTAEDLTVITNVINTARSGGQTHITIVGHTDTSGDDAYNQKLSVKRANVVVEALVDLGARRAAIKASGVGEQDLAVPTGDGVKEAKNRRAVVTLQP